MIVFKAALSGGTIVGTLSSNREQTLLSTAVLMMRPNSAVCVWGINAGNSWPCSDLKSSL